MTKMRGKHAENESLNQHVLIDKREPQESIIRHTTCCRKVY